MLRPERRPEVKRGEYCAKAESIAGVAVAVVVGEEEGVEESEEGRGGHYYILCMASR